MPAGHPNPPTRYTDVRDGDLWEVGHHLFACGDAETGATLAHLIDGKHIDLIYADPPWNDGDATVWRTRSRRDGPKGRSVKALPLLARLLRPAVDRRLLAYVEFGLPNYRGVSNALLDMGAEVTGVWMLPTSVNMKRTCALFAADFREEPRRDHPPLDGVPDGRTPGLVMSHHRDHGTVLDPCAGLGFTSRNAEAAGWHSLNHELNPDRMARAMEALEDLTGQTANLLERTTT